MKKRGLKLIIPGLLIIVIAIIWAAHTAKLINLKPVFARIPVVQKFVPPADEGEEKNDNSLPESPLERENDELRAKIKELEEQVMALDTDKTELMRKNEELFQQMNELTGKVKEQERKSDRTRELAEYYREMKPEAAASILNNMDDNTVLTILPLLEREQASKILAVMDPQRAALLSQLILENQ